MARRWYDDEFKKNAVAVAAQPGKTVAQAARELGVGEDTLRKWIGARTDPADRVPAAQSDDPVVLQREIRELRKALAQAQEEREILEKATAFFAQKRR